MKTELTIEPILLRKPITLKSNADWDDTAYHWAINLTITTDTSTQFMDQTSSKMLTVNYKTGNGWIERPKSPNFPVTDSMARAIAAGIERDPMNTGRYKPRAPALVDICSSLASDWEYGGLTFREFCDEGLFSDDDSPAKVYECWEACVRQRQDLERIGVTLELLQRYVPEDY